MKVLFDTNVVLDVLLKRYPFFHQAAALFANVEAGNINGILGATTVTTVYYICRKAIGKPKANEVIKNLLKLFEVAPINRIALDGALESKLPDFEDAVLHESGIHFGVQAIVTRDPKGFTHSLMAVHSPEELGEILSRRP